MDTGTVWHLGGHTDLHAPHYYVYDHLGNTRIVYTPLLNLDSSGYDSIVLSLVNVLDYFPYGKISREYRAEGSERYLTTGHERDEETGLDNRGARWYDSDVARFLSLDPKAMTFFNWHPYNYVFANPVRLVDPDGKGPGDSFKGFVDAVVNNTTFVDPGVVHTPSSAKDYNFGRNFGDLFSLFVATHLIEGGIAIGFASVAAAPPTGGVSLVGVGAGAVLAGYGTTVFAHAIYDMATGNGHKTDPPESSGGENTDASSGDSEGTGSSDKGQSQTKTTNSNQDSGTGRGKNNRMPSTDPTAGDHSTINERGNTTFKKNPKNPTGFDEVKRVDTQGGAHKGADGKPVPTPHVHEQGSKLVRPAVKGQDY